MTNRIWAAALLIGACGCANLDVKKVPTDKRACRSDDHVHGFRYYLTRPYIVVKSKVKVSERTTLVLATAPKAGEPVEELVYATGPNKGRAVRLDQLTATDPGTGAVRAVGHAELTNMRAALAPGVPASTQAESEPDTKNLTTPDLPTAAATGQKAIANSEIQVVFMPDLDEMYAVRSRNVLSKTAFKLDFGGDSTLTAVAAEHDSTPVAIELLRTIDKVIDSAKQTATKQLEEGGGAPGESGAKFAAPAGQEAYMLVETVYLKPGVYRLNKPWEVEGAAGATGCGLLAKLGLPTVNSLELRKVAK